MLCEEYHRDVIELLVNEERAKFRKAHNIDESNTVIYCAPGNTLKEI